MNEYTDYNFEEEHFDSDIKEQFAEDGVYGDISDEELKILMQNRKQRYTEGYNAPIRDSKLVKTRTMIIVLIAIAVYFIGVFALNVAGVINRIWMLILMAPVTLGFIIAYLLYKKNHM